MHCTTLVRVRALLAQALSPVERYRIQRGSPIVVIVLPLWPAMPMNSLCFFRRASRSARGAFRSSKHFRSRGPASNPVGAALPIPAGPRLCSSCDGQLRPAAKAVWVRGRPHWVSCGFSAFRSAPPASTPIAARPCGVMRSASGPASSSRRQTGSVPQAGISSINPSRRSLPTAFLAAPLRSDASSIAPSGCCAAPDSSTSSVSIANLLVSATARLIRDGGKVR
jgi:hypothetical protein